MDLSQGFLSKNLSSTIVQQDYHNLSVFEMLEEHAGEFADARIVNLPAPEKERAWNQAYAYVVSNFLTDKQFDAWLENEYNKAHGIKVRRRLGRPTNALTLAAFTTGK